MKKTEKKQFTELSDEELKQVTGGAGIDCSLPENKDKFQCSDKFKDLDVILDLREISFDTQFITASMGWDDVIE